MSSGGLGGGWFGGKDTVKSKANNAFKSPTALTTQRLGKRGAGGALSPASENSSVASSRSRRSQSLIAGPEEAEIFEQMTAANVVVQKKKNKVIVTSPMSPPVHQSPSVKNAMEYLSPSTKSAAVMSSETTTPTKQQFFGDDAVIPNQSEEEIHEEPLERTLTSYGEGGSLEASSAQPSGQEVASVPTESSQSNEQQMEAAMSDITGSSYEKIGSWTVHTQVETQTASEKDSKGEKQDNPVWSQSQDSQGDAFDRLAAPTDVSQYRASTPVLSYGDVGVTGQPNGVLSIESVLSGSEFGPGQTNLDLKNNDNAFYVLANLLVDFFQSRLVHGTADVVLQPEDREHLERLMPPSARLNFIAALRFRLRSVPHIAKTPLDALTLKCEEFYLDKQNAENPILAAMTLTDKPISLEVDVTHTPPNETVSDVMSASQRGASTISEKAPLSTQREAQGALPTQFVDSKAQREIGRLGSLSTEGSGTEGTTATVPASTEELARQQLMAELREASNLMADSVTPETAQFWRDHVLNLQDRLRALHGEVTSVSGQSPRSHISEEILEENRRLLNEVQQKEHYEPPDLDTAPSQISHRSQRSQRSQRSSRSHRSHRSHHSGSSTPKGQQSPTSVEMQTTTYEEKAFGEPLVDVVAPADLPGGFHFEAEIEGKRFLATVPQGGVQQGETFTCPMIELDTFGVDIPVGYWRDNVCSCFKYGCCHPVFWNGIVCPLIALGQVSARLNLDFLGRPGRINTGLSNRTLMAIIMVSWLFINLALFGGYNFKWWQGLELTLADWICFPLVNIAMFCFVVFVAQSTRTSLRERFMIREQYCCYDLEDVFCSAFCLPCVICQMARHTGNYDEYEAVCCSETGLPDNVKVNIQQVKELNTYIV